MNARQQGSPRTPERIDAFVWTFFGDGNAVWPDRNPTSDVGRKLMPFLQVLRDNSDVPVVLPRRRPSQNDRLIAYVIAMNHAHAMAVAELLTAFIGPSYTHFDGRPARLDLDDPIDRAVVAFAGPGTTFTLHSPLPQHEGAVWAALRLMQQAVARRPTRAWHVPKPVGRLLAEFEVALAAAEHSASARVLEQLAVCGGLTGPNLAHLRIKRLARLGRDHELLRLPDLADVVAVGPPTPVKDAVLTAIYNSALAGPLAGDDLPTARASLIDCGRLVPALMRSDLTGLGAQALTVVALAASIREDARVLHRLRTHPSALAQIEVLAPSLVRELALGHLPPPGGVVAARPPTPSGPTDHPESETPRSSRRPGPTWSPPSPATAAPSASFWQMRHGVTGRRQQGPTTQSRRSCTDSMTTRLNAFGLWSARSSTQMGTVSRQPDPHTP